MKNKEIVKNLIRIAKQLMADSFEDMSEKIVQSILKQQKNSLSKLKTN